MCKTLSQVEHRKETLIPLSGPATHLVAPSNMGSKYIFVVVDIDIS